MATDRYAHININWMDSEWLINPDPAARLAWIQMIVYAKGSGLDGQVKAKSAKIFGIQNFIAEEFVVRMIDAAVENGALKIQDGLWILTGWGKHQVQTSTQRVATHRAKKRAEAIEISTNDTQCNAMKRDVTRGNAGKQSLTRGNEMKRDVTRETSNVTREERRGEEKRRAASALDIPNQLLETLRQLPGVARAKSETPDRIAEVITDHGWVPTETWPAVARECRDWADGRSSLSSNSTFSMTASSLLREFVAKVIKPRFDDEKNRPKAPEPAPIKYNTDGWPIDPVTGYATMPRDYVRTKPW